MFHLFLFARDKHTFSFPTRRLQNHIPSFPLLKDAIIQKITDGVYPSSLFHFLLLNLPLFHPFGIRRKVHTNKEHFPAILTVRLGITFLMNLSQSLVGTAVEFDFHHIDVIRRFDDDVDTAAMGGALHFGIKAHHLEDDIHAVLKVELHLAHYLVTVVGEHRLQTFHESFGIAALYLLDELLDEELRFTPFFRGVIWQ